MERKHLKVLVIDDEEDVFILVKAFLNKGVRAKYEVQWANNFNHGLHQLMDKKFDVVLLDYFLGEKTGLELLQKAIKKGCDHPIIMLTSHNDPELDIKVLKAGAWDTSSRIRLMQIILNGPSIILLSEKNFFESCKEKGISMLISARILQILFA